MPPFEGFTRIGQDGWLRKGSADVVSDGQPDCILIFSWMNALPNYTNKYLVGYQRMYPAATILVVCSGTAHFVITRAMHNTRMKPIADWLKQSGFLKKRLLVHTLSNGGALQMTTIASLLRSSEGSQQAALPAQAYIYDSLPGYPSLRAFVNAFTAHLSRAPLWQKLPYYLFLVPVHYIGVLYRFILRQPTSLDMLRTMLLDPSLLRQKSSRVFIYSDADALIARDSVEEMIALARNTGPCRVELFHKSGHVAHMRSDPERYWGIVDEVYKAGAP